ncbi:MAG TPA: TonB-dependent receptor [Chitinophagales bacterium]|nr:TonB-dependent receptor [Chitinophagales bacterium]
MHRMLAIAVFIFFTASTAFSQTATIHGTIKDGTTGELLEDATVLQPPANGTHTDINGNYELKVEPGEVTIIISYVGMKPDTQHLTVKAGEYKKLNYAFQGDNNELATVVVTENKVGEKVQKVTQSIEVMKARVLESNNVTNIENAVTKMPGVSVLDGQMSVRGGSGYSYGAGSRVTLVVDEMPLMTADRQDIKWPLLPVENVEQMELVKGAASMQYGASALNGVLNITTAYARDTPTTKFTFFYEGIGRPPVDSFKWWKRDGKFLQNPNRIGMSFLHSQKFGDIEFVLSGMMQGYQSHLKDDYENYGRFSGKIKWHPHKLNRLTLELEASTLYDLYGFQFYWADAGHPYIAASGSDLDQRFFYAYIDPKIKYIDKANNEHKIYGRIYRQNNLDGETDFWVYSLAYQFRHDFGRFFRLIAGVNNDHYTMMDGTLGSHKGDFGGGFIGGQLNYKFMTFNVGVREEYVHEDSAVTPTLPVFRAGFNFEVRKYNYLRVSFGQAFRVPSIAEKYVRYSLGGVDIVPNTDLQPEHGFTAELGYKRSLKIGNWLGYVDASLFWTEFKDMVEFTFNSRSLPAPPYFEVYFQSQNISHARIFGWEFSLYGEGHIAPNCDVVATAGYTYFYGVNVDDTTVTDNRNPGKFIKNAFTHYVYPTAKDDYTWDSITEGVLKYRNPHQLKVDLDFILFNKYHIGTALQYYSYMTQVDKVFTVFIQGTDEFRIQHRNRGDAIWDLRAGYDFNRNISLNFIVKNVLNSYTVVRIARPDPPRSFTVQLVVNLGGYRKNTAANKLPITGNSL